MRKRPVLAFLFDLDGTLVDSVYQNVLAWHEAIEHVGVELSVWRIHRRVGMSGGLLTSALLRETGLEITAELTDRLQQLHTEAYGRRSHEIRPLPGACDLLSRLTESSVPWAIATSGQMANARPALEALGLDPASVPVVTRDQVKHAKPDPDLFLAAADRLGADISALGVGLLSGGYGEEELERAGAYRVYQDPRDLLRHIDEVGVRQR
jgi:phosphoglycolate phosphatase-like HAD superfamily hydrolase